MVGGGRQLLVRFLYVFVGLLSQFVVGCSMVEIVHKRRSPVAASPSLPTMKFVSFICLFVLQVLGVIRLVGSAECGGRLGYTP